jgi:F-type H+-transporting ATPase subunit delta
VIGSRVAKRYARALFELGTEQKSLEPIGKGLRSVAAAMGESADLRAVLENPKWLPEQKKAVVKALAERVGAPPIVVNALMVLADRGRLRHLGAISDAFDTLAEEAAGRLRAEVISASPLPDAYYRELEKTLAEVTGRQVTLVRREDPSLIGGVVARVGDTVFDGSLKNRLADIRHQMLVAASPGGRLSS